MISVISEKLNFKFVLKLCVCIFILSFMLLITPNTKADAHTGYSGYVWVSSSSADRFVYVRPDSSSMQVGSVWAEWVTVYWKEGSFYYVRYSVSGYGGYKRGYIKEAAMNQLQSGIPQNNPYPAWGANCGSGSYTVYNRTEAVSYVIGSMWSSEPVTVLAEEGSWYYLQYAVSSGYKRGYVQKGNITKTPETSGITNGSTYYIKNENSGKYLDVYWGQQTSGTDVLQYYFNGDTNQQWKVEYLPSEGLYKLHPQNAPSMNLDVLGSSMNNGDDIVIYDGDYSSSRWNIVNLWDGTFKLMSNCSERTKAMVVENESLDAGANVFQWDFNNTVNDKWVFESIPENTWSYSDGENFGSYCPQSGKMTFFHKNSQNNVTTTTVKFSLSSDNVLKILDYNNGGTNPHSATNNYNCYLTLDVSAVTTGGNDDFSAYSVASNLPDPHFDIENDQWLNSRNEESEVVALGSVGENINYSFLTHWEDYRGGASNDSGVMNCQFGISALNYGIPDGDYNTIINAGLGSPPSPQFSWQYGVNYGQP